MISEDYCIIDIGVNPQLHTSTKINIDEEVRRAVNTTKIVKVLVDIPAFSKYV